MPNQIKILYTTMLKHRAYVKDFESYQKAMNMYDKYQNVQHIKINICVSL